MEETRSNFIHDIIDEDLSKNPSLKIHTRFPPEPNGYLHIGHCKALVIDFGTARKYNGLCNLRMDDTNPAKEDTEFVDAIQEDIHWLGFDWEDRFFYGSDYFEKDYELAVGLIKKGLAYVCELSAEEMDSRAQVFTSLKTAQMQKAWFLLTKKYADVRMEDGYIRVYDIDDVEEIVSYLMENGHIVSEIKKNKIGLEEYYIELMSGQGGRK